MWPFKRKQESSPEVAADEGRDEELRDVGWDEFYKEADLEASSNLGTALLDRLPSPGRWKAHENAVPDPERANPSRPTSAVGGRLFKTTNDGKSSAKRDGVLGTLRRA